MPRKETCREAVDYGKTVSFRRSLHEVRTRDGMHLIMTRKVPADAKPLAPVILVHGLGQNRFSWTLSQRSLENYLVSQGFETYNVELRGHGLSRANGCDYPTHFETYLFYDMPALFDAVRKLSQGKKMFYMGHSLGGTISYCLGARYQEYLAGILSIAGPFNLGKGNLVLKAMARVGVGMDRVIPFRLLHPEAFYVDVLGILAKSGLRLLDNRLNTLPVQVWYPGSIERDILKERLERGFDRTSFNVAWLLLEWASSGKFHSTDGIVDFEEQITDLEIPILFVVGDRDFLVPVASVREGFEKAGSRDKTLKVFGEEARNLHWGHCDLVCGRDAPRHVWPFLLDWMLERTEPQKHTQQ